MLWFIGSGRRWRTTVTAISKHLMLWFISFNLFAIIDCIAISKHLMLWFIINQISLCIFRINFKTSYVMVYRLNALCNTGILSFQNILCYGLSESAVLPHLHPFDFKTSYVMVYLITLFSNI